jgi:hypothetical protein
MTSYLIDTINELTRGREKKELLGYAYRQKNLLHTYRDYERHPLPLPPFKDAYLCNVHKEGTNIIATFILYVTKEKSTVLSLIFDYNKKPYPWYAPDVKIFDYNYHILLKTDLSIFRFEKVRCLCCESLQCKNNWGVTKCTTDLLKEVKKNLILKLRKSDLICCKHVVEQIFGTYIPIDRFL